MKILARGEKIRTEELKLKLSSVVCDLKIIDDTDLSSANLNDYDLIFDLDFDEHSDQLNFYAGLTVPVIVSCVKTQLAKAVHDYGKKVNCTLIGMNCLPTFIDRELAEVSLFDSASKPKLEALMQQLNWKYKLIEDRVKL